MEMEMMEQPGSAPLPSCRADGRKLSRCPRLQLDAKTASAIEQAAGAGGAADAGGCGGGGAMRFKVVLSKQQLKQMAAAALAGGGLALPPALEQLVQVLRRQHARKQASAAGRRRARWSPALESIPEECYGDLLVSACSWTSRELTSR